MAKQETIKVAAGPVQPVHQLERPQDTQTTAWEDPWSATKIARETSPHGETVRREARPVGQRITEEINADPEEAERLRKARQDARDGKTFPRHSDTKSS